MTLKRYNIAVCASGGGGNLKALIDAQTDYGFTISLVIVDRECNAITKATTAGIPVKRLTNSKDPKLFAKEFINIVPEDINLIVLAGFMPIIPPEVCDKWNGLMINTHPSLLPKYGGKGMYGVKVQEAVMKARERFAGCTIHFVNSTIDGGSIILQKKIEVDYSLTPWELGGVIFKEENKLLVKAVAMLMEDDNLNRQIKQTNKN